MNSAAKVPPADPQGSESIADIPRRFLARGYIRLSKDGRWLVAGEPITHPKLAAFLWRRLRRTVEGDYWIVNGPQRVLVELADAPFVVQHIEVEGGRLAAWLSDGSREFLDVASLAVGSDHVIHAWVKAGCNGARAGERHRARFSRSAVAELEPFLAEDGGGFVIIVGGRRLGRLNP